MLICKYAFKIPQKDVLHILTHLTFCGIFYSNENFL